jgi:hypothetical protein
MAASVTVTRMKPTITQLTSSIVREIFRPSKVMTKITPIRPTASQLLVFVSPSPGMSPVKRVKSPSPAPDAQPPVMNAR